MSSSVKKIEISQVGANIEIVTLNTVKPNVPECYPLMGIKSVVPIYDLGIGRSGITGKTPYPHPDMLMIVINFHNEHANPPLRFDLATVNNQAGWTLDVPGLIQAKNDICAWLTSVVGGSAGGLATEVTLSAVNTKLAPITGVVTSLSVITGAGAASVAAGKRTVSFFNSGAADTTVNGATLKAGVGITYPELSNRDTYGAIPYDALTSELTITTVG